MELQANWITSGGLATYVQMTIDRMGLIPSRRWGRGSIDKSDKIHMPEAILAQGVYFRYHFDPRTILDKCQHKKVFLSMASHYSTPRLEGRALEHALARDAGFRIRMKSSVTGAFECVGGDSAKAIRNIR